ncbi:MULTISPECIES: mannose-6-phosphate isomerase, class I [unclassified Gilliamella]|uniref:mannose-6-phosphate isomerase, class I n=1 Tax=unclassified Gilliamella TaxID=2685620 RepID=UPI001324CBE4|nr:MULTISPECIES: mannose-6-phosphate isomerase, class I [unclassified Gilliamella]MWN32455.1 mannose-6-phosphate isomerase, class I [Gilliamella sp. Pra-s60]MWP29842.1 mannose-6-phosphate isomerase, class I [Gilliamella sp. Pra-s54]
MNQTIWKLENTFKNYYWGSVDNIPKLFGFKNSTREPIAEVWMGAHTMGCSLAVINKNHKIRLDELIKNNPLDTLGEKTTTQFASLPFLFKILSANKALSIQVHPTKINAEQGFERENLIGIAIDSPSRNYKDSNHKPELIYALTPFKAMRSFRPINEILSFFENLDLPVINLQISLLRKNRTPFQLKKFIEFLLNLSQEDKAHAIKQLLVNITKLDQEPYTTIKSLINDYPNDIGLFMPLILNIIELQPGQAMFLEAETPHAYLCGTGLEIMANSDNVLRAGLTNKLINTQEFIQNTNFESLKLEQLLIKPVKMQNKDIFSVPVNDFKFEIIQSNNQLHEEQVNSPQIVLCITGEITITTKSKSLTLTNGESAFIAYNTKIYRYKGNGILAKVFN